MKHLPSALLLVLALSACQPAADAAGKIGVVVTLLPQAEFVESVGGDKVEITVMVPPGASPHTYEPTPSQMTALARAKIYAKVGSGVEFELVWMGRLLEVNQAMLVVDCAKGVELQEAVDEHEHHEQEHEGLDPHIWMSPLNAVTMVSNICDGLVQVDPANRAYYQENRDAYIHELEQLDRDIREGLSGMTSRAFMVCHPAFGYFARDYDLAMIAIEEEGKEPTPSGLARLIEQAKEHEIEVIFTSPQFNPESAQVIAQEIGGRVVLVDPLARDYIASLHLLLDGLLSAVEQK